MARSRRKPVVEVDFSDVEQAREWLQRQPDQLHLALSVRATLRALPVLSEWIDARRLNTTMLLPVLRACAASWAYVRLPAHASELRAAYLAAASASADAHSAADIDAANALDYVGALGSPFAIIPTLVLIGEVSTSNAGAVFGIHRALLTRAVRADAAFIAGEQHGAERASLAVRLVEAALWWPEGMDDFIKATWEQLRASLLAINEGWEVWIAWYEDLLAGRRSLGEAFDLAVASLTEEEWNEEPRPAAVNRRIAALLAEHTGRAVRPEAEARATREAEPQTEPDPAASEVRQSPKPDRRGNSGRAKRTARTTIGKALLERSEQVQLALVAVISLIDEKLPQLKTNPPNSDEAQREWTNEISELEKLRLIVEALQADVADYLAGAKAENETVRSVKSFAEGVEDYWSKNSVKILQSGFNAAQTGFSVGLFTTAVLACTAMGAGGTITTAICGALVGGKPAIEALKAVAGRSSEAIRKVSGRHSQKRK